MKHNSAILGAAFLMATSAIGPGFLTQTTVFTNDLKASFGFVILISILIDIGAQLNIWRVITMSEMPVQDLANRLLQGLGTALALLIATGSLVFNIGNIGGAALGLQMLTGIPISACAIISCVIAIAIFWYKEAGELMDNFAKILGILMVILTTYIAFIAHPPLGDALYRSIIPEQIDMVKIVTLVGGTVGGYISFAGAHRLLDAGIKGESKLRQVSESAVSGILITALMRYILFLAALGVVWTGFRFDAQNPAASVFQYAGGTMGYLFFGVVLWSASITSVVGASYTTISFWKTLSPFIKTNEKYIISVFICLSSICFLFNPKPVQLLLFAGAANGVILPIALAVILLIARQKKIFKTYQHPLWLEVIGWLVVIVMTYMSGMSIGKLF
jgi:Mn2+/Fe2+ NRAMP family transporter